MADDPKNEVIEGHDRRGFLKTAVGVTAVVAAQPLHAQGTQPGAPTGPRKPGRLPANTPIIKLGFSAAEIAQMTPAVQKLTKGDLMELQQWQGSGDTKDAPLHLSLQDLNSL